MGSRLSRLWDSIREPSIQKCRVDGPPVKTSFGFVSKNQKGADAPIADTEFQFKVADLNVHSSSYHWLVCGKYK